MKRFFALVTLPSLLWSGGLIAGGAAGCLFALAWPLVGASPGHRLQTGLCGTWMHPQWSEAEKRKEKCGTDIEGGPGWRRDAHFPTITPKFIMGGVGPNFSVAVNGPGYSVGAEKDFRQWRSVCRSFPPLIFFPIRS